MRECSVYAGLQGTVSGMGVSLFERQGRASKYARDGFISSISAVSRKRP
jgi:hypothetical protein